MQLNDVAKASGDSYAVRGSLTAAPGTDPLADALVTGVTVAVYETRSGASVLVDSVTFGTSQCRATAGQSPSLVCKDRVSGSFFRMRGKAATPGSFRVNTLIKRRNLAAGKPFDIPLAGGVKIGAQSWLGKTTASTCTISSGGDRTTCR